MTYWRHRVICDVLEDMRKRHKTRNFSSLLGLIEEAQSMANRMEAGLHEKGDLESIHKDWLKARNNLKEAAKEDKDLTDKIKKLKEEVNGLLKKKDKLLNKIQHEEKE